MKDRRGSMIDIGEALAREQMAEYRAVHGARERGEPLRALTWAANIGVGLIVAFLVALLVWSSAT